MASNPRLRGIVVAPDLAYADLIFDGADGMTVVGAQGRVFVAQGVAGVTLSLTESAEVERRVFQLLRADDVAAGSLTIEYYSGAYYETAGVDLAGVIQVVTDLPRSAGPGLPADAEWQVPPLPGQSGSTAGPWDRLLDGTGGTESHSLLPMSQAFLSLMDESNASASRDLCSDFVPAQQIWDSVVAGRCYAWCTGLAQMLAETSRSIGVPARRVDLIAPAIELPNGIIVQTSEQHTALEVYVDGRWRWLDPTLRVWEVRDADGQALSLVAVVTALADPASRSGLVIDVIEPDATIRTVPIRDAPTSLLISFSRYLTLDKAFKVRPD